MNLRDITSRIKLREGEKSLVVGIALERHQGVDQMNSEAALIVFVDRRLTVNGGNGWDGVDGSTMDMIHKACREAIFQNGGLGMVTKIIVREASAHLTGGHQEV